jgi:hypothetical protein
MGYACPVCGSPQVDAIHLANHVAFTALTGDDEHEEWLDEHVPEWGERGDEELAEAVLAHAAETDVADAFDEDGATPSKVGRKRADVPALDDDAADVLAEAREFTRQMLDGETDEEDTEEDPAAKGTETADETE